MTANSLRIPSQVIDIEEDFMNEPSVDRTEAQQPDEILERALASIQSETVPAGPTPELISATHYALWYPFRSAEVSDICRHMTPEETRQLTARAWKTGLIAGIVPSLIFYPLFLVLALYTPLYPPRPWSLLVLLGIAILVGLLMGWIGFAGIRRKQIQMLCETDYAKQKGFTPQTLRLYSLPSLGLRGWLLMALIASPLVLLCVLLGVSPLIPGVAQVLRSQDLDPEARRVLDQMSSVYANCKTYQDSGVVRVLLVRESGNHATERPFTTAFVRNDRFRYEFKDLVGSSDQYYRYLIWSDGKEVRSWWDVKPGGEKPSSLNSALHGADGVSGGSARTIPAFLLPRQVWPNLGDTIITVHLEDAKLDGIDCFRITGKYAGNPMTVWIEKQTYLIRRIDQRMKVEDFVVETTTTYTPVLDGDVPEKMLKFDPPDTP